MTTLMPTDFRGQNSVDGYGPGFFRIAGDVHHGAYVILSDRIIPWGGLDDLAPLADLVGQVDVLFLGLGGNVALPPRELIAHLSGLGLQVEATTAPIAARTYNVTLSEGRRVACALLPV